ncbi:hypothetical protein KAR04_08205 [Candidatus Calescamantes bacterium]|nr:hypothetical protein [Candidatus Calescamantes bacterium]
MEPSLFIDREDELSHAMQCLFSEGMNINVFGEPGIGKTSFLNKLRDEIIKAHPDTLVIQLFLLSYVERETVDLARIFLLAIADAIWEEVFKSPYSELMQLLGQPDPASATFSKEKRSFLRIYRLLRSGSISSQVEETAELEGKLVLGAKKGEKYWVQYQISDLFQFEFSRLLSELIPVMEKSKKSRIVILADEANYLRGEKAEQVLRRNFDILLDNRIRYVFVTFESAKKTFYEADKVLHQEVFLGPFPNESVLDQLIDWYCASFASIGEQTLKFTRKARQAIWEKSQGHPFKIQRLCRGAWLNAKHRRSTTVDIEDVETALHH